MRQSYKKPVQDWEFGYVEKIIDVFRFQEREKWRHLKRMEYKDLVQDCNLEWIQKRKRYKHKKSALKTYMSLVITRKLHNLAKMMKAKKRQDLFDPPSLDAPLWDDKLAQTLGEKISDRKNNSDRPFMKAELYEILSKAIPKLPSRQRKICNFIKKSKSRKVKKTEIAKKFKINRKTVWDEMNCLKKAFVDEGIERYLEEL